MNRRSTAVVLSLALIMAGCDSAETRDAKRAEERYRVMLSSLPRAEERCRAQREVAEAWLKALDPNKYQSWKLRADLTCNRALLNSLNG